MITRQKKADILKSLSHFPAVGIIGPRQCGKTTLAKEVLSDTQDDFIYLDLESKRDTSILNDPELFFGNNLEKTIIIDEIQVQPDLFPILRSSIDQHRVPSRFIILGSSSPQLLRHSNESLAGRISYHELTPLNITEIEDFRKHLLFGGYPECYLQKDETIISEWLSNYINSYVERELPALGLKTSATNIFKLWRMIASIHGNLLNIDQLSRSLGVSATSIRNYLDFMEEAFLIRRLTPYHFNIKKRLVKAPKVYVRDSGILNYMLGLESYESLELNAMLGAIWEGYVIEQIYSSLPQNKSMHFYRTHHGSEIDLLISQGINPQYAIEIKYSSAPKLTQGFYNALEDIGIKKGFVIVPEDVHYQLNEQVEVIGLPKFVQEYMKI